MYKVSQEVAVASLFLSLKDPRHDPGVLWLSSPVAMVLAVWQVLVLGSDVSVCKS